MSLDPMDVTIAILEGIPGALLATALTVLFVHFIRPRIDISPYITAKWSEELNSLRYGFKIVNKSRRPLVDLRFELIIQYPNEAGRPKNVPIERKAAPPMSITGRNPKKGDAGDYIITYPAELMDEIIKRELPGDGRCKLRLRIFGRDGWSGTGKQFQMTYDQLFDDRIIFGAFERGAGLAVIASPQPHPQWTQKINEAKALLRGQTSSLTQTQPTRDAGPY